MQNQIKKTGIKFELWQLYVLTAIVDSGLGSIFALLAEIRDQFGFSVVDVSMIGAAGFISAFIAQISLARFADRGHARFLIMGGLIVAGAAMLGLALSSGLLGFVGFRFLFGVGQGAIVPAIRRLVIMKNPGSTGEALGRLAAFHLFGFLMGPALGAGLTSAFGLAASFWVFGALILGCLPLVSRVAMPRDAQGPSKRTIRNLLKKRGIVALLVAAVGYYGSFGIYESMWAVFMSDMGASTLFIGFQLTLFSLPMILMAPLGGRIAEKVGPMTMAITSLLLIIPLLALYGILEGIILLTALMLAQGIVEASITPAMQLGISTLSGEDQASGQGLLNASGLMIAATVALTSGAVYQFLGPFGLFVSWAAVMAVAVLAAALIGRGVLQSEARQRASQRIPKEETIT